MNTNQKIEVFQLVLEGLNDNQFKSLGDAIISIVRVKDYTINDKVNLLGIVANATKRERINDINDRIRIVRDIIIDLKKNNLF